MRTLPLDTYWKDSQQIRETPFSLLHFRTQAHPSVSWTGSMTVRLEPAMLSSVDKF